MPASKSPSDTATGDRDQISEPCRFPVRYVFRHEGDMLALNDALLSETLSGESSLIEKYEAKLSEYFGSACAVAVSSGSAAIHSALMAVGATSGTEVLVPATAPLPSVFPVLTSGAIPVIVDVCRDHLAFNPEDLARKITSRTRAALSVALWGYPQDLGPTIELLQERSIPLIEDACQAHGTKVSGQYAGTVGSIGCFSTHCYKPLSTGEGGFVLTDDPSIASEIRKFSRLGGLDGVHHGVNYKLSALGASLGTHPETTVYMMRSRS